MQSQSLISSWRQRFTCGSCALALVGSLALYHKTVLNNPILVVQPRLGGNPVSHPKGIRSASGPAAIAFGTNGVLKRVLLGRESYWNWEQLLMTTKFNTSR